MLPSISPPPRVGAPHSRQSKGTGGRGDRARSLAEDERDELTYFLTTGCDVDEETLQVALRLLGDDTTVHVLVEEPRLVDRVVLSPASAASVASLAALPVQDVFAVSGGNIFVSASFLPALVASLEEGEPPQLRDFILTTPGVVSRAQPLAGLTVGVCAEVNWCSQALLRDVVLARQLLLRVRDLARGALAAHGHAHRARHEALRQREEREEQVDDVPLTFRALQLC